MGARLLVLTAAVVLTVPLGGCFDRSPFQSAPYDFIRDDPYGALHIEVDYVDGQAPASSATDLLQQRANERLRKPDRITLETNNIGQGRSSWSISDLKAAEDDHRDRHPGGNTMVLYVLYVDGESSDEGNAIGVKYDHTSIAIFKEKIRSGSFVGLSSAGAERAVLIHEFGHAIGLVDCGIPMVEDHDDPEHGPCHSNNEGSVMYYAVETSEIGLISGGPSTQFDENDIQDIRAAGGK